MKKRRQLKHTHTHRNLNKNFLVTETREERKKQREYI